MMGVDWSDGSQVDEAAVGAEAPKEQARRRLGRAPTFAAHGVGAEASAGGLQRRSRSGVSAAVAGAVAAARRLEAGPWWLSETRRRGGFGAGGAWRRFRFFRGWLQGTHGRRRRPPPRQAVAVGGSGAGAAPQARPASRPRVSWAGAMAAAALASACLGAPWLRQRLGVPPLRPPHPPSLLQCGSPTTAPKEV